MQMEEEHDERQKLVREKRELERQMQHLSEQKPARDRGLLMLHLCLFLTVKTEYLRQLTPCWRHCVFNLSVRDGVCVHVRVC